MKFGYFNGLHFIFLAIIPIFILVLFFALRHAELKVKKYSLFGVSVAVVLIYVIYKLVDVFVYSNSKLEFYPFQLCNVLILLLPFAFYFNNRVVRGIVYYLSVPAALLAVLFPDSVFIGSTGDNAVLIMFFITHALLISLPIVMVALGMYKPTIKDALISTGALILYVCFAHVINVIFRESGYAKNANYFYTFGQKDNVALNFFYKLIPVPLVFEFPLIAIAGGVFCLEAYVARLIDKKRKNRVNEI